MQNGPQPNPPQWGKKRHCADCVRQNGQYGGHLRAITGLWASPSGRSGLTNGRWVWREGESRVVFWSIAIALSIAVLATVLMTMVRARPTAASAAEFDLRVYRDQLREVEKDIARGLVNAEDAERIRTEISRRILEADKISQGLSVTDQAPMPLTFSAFAFCTVLVIGGGAWMYASLGAPGYPDLPLATRIDAAERAREIRPGQGVAEAEATLRNPPPPEDAYAPDYLALVNRLREAVQTRPDDLRGHELLARQEAGMGRFAEAWKAKARSIELRGPDDASVQDFVDLVDMMVLAAGGYVSPEAEVVLGQVLARDPSHGIARYYTGLMMGQTGRPDVAFNIWAKLLAEGPADALWQDPVRAQIDHMAMRAGVDYVAPVRTGPVQPGPSASDIEAAAEMSADDRMSMIEGMVSGLAERLAQDGGPPEDWARLIRAYGVLGQRQAAAAIWAEAQDVFPDDINRVVILQAARDAGVAQ